MVDKKSKTILNTGELKRTFSIFTKQTDRGSALFATAWVDDSLYTYVKSILYQDQALIKNVLRSEGQLGSFSSRINLVYLTGKIDSAAKNDLEIIRAIRNSFAHVRENIRFSDASIKIRCNQLSAPKALGLGGMKVRSPREKFLITCYFLSEHLLELSKHIKPPDLLLIDYCVPLRRFAKSLTLQNVLKSIEAKNN